MLSDARLSSPDEQEKLCSGFVHSFEQEKLVLVLSNPFF